MIEETLQNEVIRLKQFIDEKEFKELSNLERLCCSQDKLNLKLELDYKLNIRKNTKSEEINEFLLYCGDVLAAYLGINSFGGSNIAELNGMTHPEFRRKGLFGKLFKLAIEECQKRNFDKILLLSDGKSSSGVKFIEHVYGTYDFSEYRMKVYNKIKIKSTSPIELRKAEKKEVMNEFTYMIQLKEMVIGKIRISYSDQSAFISGFEILPEFRGRGYGKLALKKALHVIFDKSIFDIELDVECKNSRALHLYKSCGFEEMSIMKYYEYPKRQTKSLKPGTP